MTTLYGSHASSTEYLALGTRPDSLNFFEKTLAAPVLAATYAATSIWNSAAELARIFPGIDEQNVNKYKTSGYALAGDLYGRAWQKFYADNSAGIELGGELLSLAVPGAATYGILKAAKAGKWGLGALSSPEKYRLSFDQRITTALNSGKTLESLKTDTLKTYTAGAISAFNENAIFTLASYTLLNESRMFDDATLGNISKDLALGTVITAPFKLLGSAFTQAGAVKKFELGVQAADKVNFGAPSLPAWKRLQNALDSRRGKEFQNKAAETQFKLAVRETLAEIAPGLDKELTPLVESFGSAGNERITEDFISGLMSLKSLDIKAGTKREQAIFANLLKNDRLKRLAPEATGEETLEISFSDKGRLDKKAGKVIAATKRAGGQKISVDVDTVDLSLLSYEARQEILGAAKFAEKAGSAKVKKARANAIYLFTSEEGKTTLYYIRNRADAQKVILSGKGAPELYNEEVQRTTSFLNLDTGVVSDLVVPYAGDLGASFSGTGVKVRSRLLSSDKVSKSKLLTTKSFKEDIFLFTPYEADALHALSQHIGATKGLAERAYKLDKKTDGFSFAFSEDTIFDLQAGIAWAVKNGESRVPFFSSKENSIYFKSVKETEEKLGQQKTGLYKQAQVDGYSETEIDRILAINSKELGEGQFETVFTKAGETDPAQLLKVRQVQLEYNTAGLPTREQAIAKLQQETQDAVIQERVFETLQPELQNILDLKRLPLPEIAAEKITSEAGGADLLRFGGRGSPGSAQSQSELTGTLLSQAARNFVKQNDSIVTAGLSPLVGNYVKLAELSFVVNAVRSNPKGLVLRQNLDGKYFLWDTVNDTYAIGKTGVLLDEVSPEVGAAIQAYKAARAKVQNIQNATFRSQGIKQKFDNDILYFEPARGQFFSLVRLPGEEGTALINGVSAESLLAKERLVSAAFPDAKIFRKADIAADKKILQEYDKQDLFVSRLADSALRRKGIAGDLIPLDQGTILDELRQQIANASRSSLRNAVSAYYARYVRDLDYYQKLADSAVTSTKGRVARFVARESRPFAEAKAALLNRSIQSDFPLLDTANKFANNIIASGQRAVQDFWEARPFFKPDFNLSASDSKTLQELTQKYGVQHDYTKVAETLNLGKQLNEEAGTQLIAKLNGFYATWQLSRDFMNTAVNVLSFPMTTIPAFKHLYKQLKEGTLEGDAAEKLLVRAPGLELPQISPVKAIALAVRNFSRKESREKLLQEYIADGHVPVETLEFTRAGEEYLGALGRVGEKGGWSKLRDVGAAVGDKILTWSTVKPNIVLRFLAANMMETMLDAAKITDKALRRTMTSDFVKVTQHSFSYAQRPVIFQGPVGSGLTLYQTFMFNTLQNLSRYAGKGDAGALAAFGAWQASTFGLQSNPIFHALNASVAYKEGNPNRKDLYAKAEELETWGDFILYGPVSAGLGTTIYSRGDLTPRSPVLLPTAITDMPFISQSLRILNAAGRGALKLWDTKGEGAGQIALEAVQQSGLSRPLAGIAAMLSGETVDSDGDKISDAHILEAVSLLRVTGGRPLDEAKTLQIYYNTVANKGKDRELVNRLGQAIKSKISADILPTTSDTIEFMEKYVRAGGSKENFPKYYREIMEKASIPLAARMQDRWENDPDLASWMRFLQGQNPGS